MRRRAEQHHPVVGGASARRQEHSISWLTKVRLVHAGSGREQQVPAVWVEVRYRIAGDCRSCGAWQTVRISGTSQMYAEGDRQASEGHCPDDERPPGSGRGPDVGRGECARLEKKLGVLRCRSGDGGSPNRGTGTRGREQMHRKFGRRWVVAAQVVDHLDEILLGLVGHHRRQKLAKGVEVDLADAVALGLAVVLGHTGWSRCRGDFDDDPPDVVQPKHIQRDGSMLEPHVVDHLERRCDGVPNRSEVDRFGERLRWVGEVQARGVDGGHIAQMGVTKIDKGTESSLHRRRERVGCEIGRRHAHLDGGERSHPGKCEEIYRNADAE